MMGWVGCLLTDSEIFILFAENSQMLLKIYVIPILWPFMYLFGSTESASKQPIQLIIEINSSLRHTIICEQ